MLITPSSLNWFHRPNLSWVNIIWRWDWNFKWTRQFNNWKWSRCHLEKAMAPHSSTLAWKIPWMEEPGRLKSMGSLKVGHDRATSLSLFTFMHWRRKGQPTPVFFSGESQGRGSRWAAVYGVAQSRTRLKWLSRKMPPDLTILWMDNYKWIMREAIPETLKSQHT